MDKSNLFLSRFFSTGPAIIVAFDHGMFDGPIPGVDKVAADRIISSIAQK